MGKAMGCLQLEDIIHMLGSSIHVYGHSHCPADVVLSAATRASTGIGGSPSSDNAARRSCRYVQHPLEGSSRASLLCIWEGREGEGQACYELDLKTGQRLL
jgi:hypothetical protein